VVLKDQEVAEKMLQHANQTWNSAIEQEDIVATKVAKEVVSVATKKLETAM